MPNKLRGRRAKKRTVSLLNYWAHDPKKGVRFSPVQFFLFLPFVYSFLETLDLGCDRKCRLERTRLILVNTDLTISSLFCGLPLRLG